MVLKMKYAVSLLVWIVLLDTCFASLTYWRIYTCPLWARNNKKGRRKRDLNFGFVHSYTQIGNTCYEWVAGDRQLMFDCSSPGFRLCARNRSFRDSGYTRCAENIYRFRFGWYMAGIEYDFLISNCQRYTNVLKEFLESRYCRAYVNVGLSRFRIQ